VAPVQQSRFRQEQRQQSATSVLAPLRIPRRVARHQQFPVRQRRPLPPVLFRLALPSWRAFRVSRDGRPVVVAATSEAPDKVRTIT
jgi:hypothetical protein